MRSALSLGLAVALAGCSDASTPPPTEAVMPASELFAEAPLAAFDPAAEALSALPFAEVLVADTPYAEVRDAVAAAGWRPVITSACAENVGGEATACREWPELDACSGSGDGPCLMAFADPNAPRELQLATVGGSGEAYSRGADARVRLQTATLRVLDPTPVAACPSTDFAMFLEAFAADPAVRAAWTAPLVRVAVRYELGEDSRVVDAVMRADAFRGFPVVHENGAFHYRDAAGVVDPAPLTLTWAEDGAGSVRVSFDYGLSEGNSLRFTRSDDCWQLAEDPEPDAA